MLEKESDIYFNDAYLKLVHAELGKMDSSSLSASKFWMQNWLETSNEDVRQRALRRLNAIFNPTTTSKRSRNPSAINAENLNQVLTALNSLDLINPSEQELSRIREGFELFMDKHALLSAELLKIQTTLQSFQPQESSRRAWLWFLWHFEKRLTQSPLNRAFRKMISQSNIGIDDYEHPIMKMRIAELLDKQHVAVNGLIERDDLDSDVKLAIFVLDMGLKRSNIEYLSSKQKQILRKGTPDQIAPLMDLVRQLAMKEKEKRVAYFGGRDLSNRSTERAWMVELLVNPNPSLFESASLYRVNLWGGALLSEHRKVNLLKSLLEILAEQRYSTYDIQDKRDEYLAALKKIIEDTDDEQVKALAREIHWRIKHSDKVEAYVRASVIKLGARSFKKAMGVFPDSTKELMVLPEGLEHERWNGPHLKSLVHEQDPWGNEFKFLKSEIRNQIEIISAGPDGEFSTSDDVSTKDEKLEKLIRR